MARSDLLRAVIYPDSDDVENPLGNGTDTVYDRVEYKYNRLGQTVEMKDQAGTVHAYDYDKLGRLTQDRITAFGSGVDQTVKRIGRTYEVRGMLEKVTSHDHATVGQGNVVNEVQHAYNTFGQLVTEYQEHGGAVNTGSSLKTQYGHADGGSSANHIRPTTLTYPKTSRVITFDYGTASAMNDVLGRVENVKESTTTYASYTYLGAGTIVRTDLPVPEVRLDLWGGTSGTYAGIDRFGRTVSHGWVYYNGGATDRDRFEYGYDRAGNRLFKDNTVTTLRDELYTYDGLHRLAKMDRGTLNGGKTAIDGTPAREEQYTLDPTGNWATYLTKTSGSTDLDHDRDHNEANEVGTITTNTGGSWISPVHDPAGNMTQVPKPGAETTRLHLVYDAWNRMVIAKNDDGGSPGTTIATYGYDGKGRRINKAINGGDTFDYYYNDRYQLLEVRKNADTDPLEHYVWDISYIDAPLIWFRDSNVDGTVDDTMYPARDANFNVTALIDTSGTVQERYLYDPYGKRTILDGSWGARGSSSYDWTLGHQGLMLDGETGLYYNRARMLHPMLGRFVQRDRLGYVDGASLYEYLKTNPVNGTDPTGKVGPAVVAAAVVIAGVVACAAPWYSYSMRNHAGRTDRFRHCYVSCEIAKTCGLAFAEAAGLSKELRDMAVAVVCELFPDLDLCQGGHGDFWDSIGDLLANQDCIAPESYWLGPICRLWRESCFDCCNRKHP